MFLDFEKPPLVVMTNHYEIWVILRHVYGLFAGGTSVILLSIFLSRIWNESVLSTNDILSISESTWSFLYPRFTNHCFNCSRWLLSFSSVEQILLNLTTCPYAIDPLYKFLRHDCAWGTGAYQLVYCIDLFLTYCQLSLKWYLKS